MILRRILTITLIAGLLAAVALSAFFRGGVDRLLWVPVAALISGLVALTVVAHNHDHLPRHLNLRVALPLVGFLTWVTLSYPGSICQESTFFELFRLYAVGAVFFLVTIPFENRWEKWALALGVFLLGAAEAVFGLTEYASGQQLLAFSFLPAPPFQRVTGTFGNPNHFAAFLNMSFFLGLALVSAVRGVNMPVEERWAQKAIFALPLGIILVALVLTLSRGGWVSFAAGIMVWLWQLWRHRRPGLSRIPLVAALALAVSLVFIARLDLSFLEQRLETFGEIYERPEELTGDGRLAIWKSTIKMIADRPLFGTGWGTYRWAFPAYRQDNLFFGVQFAHNDYLQIAAEAGIPALLFFLVFVGSVFREGFRVIRRRPEDSGARAAMAVGSGMFAVLLHEFVDFGLMVPANLMVFFLMAAVLVCVEDGR